MFVTHLWLSNGSYCDFGLLLLLPSVRVCLSSLSVRRPVWSCESASLSLFEEYCYPMGIPDFTKHNTKPELGRMGVGLGREGQHQVLGSQVFMRGSLTRKEGLRVTVPCEPPPQRSRYRQAAGVCHLIYEWSSEISPFLLWKEAGGHEGTFLNPSFLFSLCTERKTWS